MRTQKTDDEMIEAIRAREHWRRPVGSALIAVGACTFWFTQRTVSLFSENMGDAVGSLTPHLRTLGDGAMVLDAVSALQTAAYLSGKAVAQGTVLGMLLCCLGLIYAFGKRREDDMLLRYYAEAREETEPAGG